MSWASELEKAGVPAAVQKLIIEQGYDSAAVFHNAFVNGAALEGWLVRIQKDIEAYKNLNTEEWATHPVAAKLRILWKGLGSEQAATGTPVSSLALAVKQNLAPAKLSTSDRDRLRKEVEKRFPSHVFGADTLPSMPFLQLIHSQCLGQHWEWVPWRRIMSEALSQESRAQRSVSSEADLLSSVADSMGVLKEERPMQEAVSSAYRIQCLLDTRGNAYAMCKAAHLGTWAMYTKKFLLYYTKKHAAGQRGPNGVEAEEADRACFAEIMDLCFNGVSMDDAVHQVAVERDMLRHLLIPQNRPSKPELSLPKGKGKGKKRYETDDRAVLPSKRPRTGECWKWLAGKCKEPQCRFRHACAKCGSGQHGSADCDKGNKVQ